MAMFAVWVSASALSGQRHRIPYYDDWRILRDFFEMPLWEFVFSPQNGHRIPTSLLLLAADYRWLYGDQLLLVVASIATAVATVVVLFAADRAAGPDADGLRWLRVGLAGFFIFWSGGAFYFLWGVTHGNVQAAFCLVVCLYFLVRDESQRSARGAAGAGRWLAGAALAACAGTYSFGSGFAIWLVLLGVLVVRRYPVRQIALLVAAAVSTLLAYVQGLADGVAVSWDRSIYSFTHRTLDAIAFVCRFVGSLPGWTAGGIGVGEDGAAAISLVSGVVGLVSFAAYGLWLWRRPVGGSPRLVIAFGLMGCAAASALIVAFGRLGGGAMELAIRYVLWSALFWLGVAYAILCRPAAAARPRRLTAIGGVFAASLIMVPSLLVAREHELGLARRGLRTAPALLLGIESPETASGVHEPARYGGIVYEVAGRLKRDRRNLFADFRSDLPGADIDDRFEPAAVGRCERSRIASRVVETSGPPAVRVRGWAKDWYGADLELVVIGDGAGAIVGLAEFVPTGMPFTGSVPSGSSEFWGYVKGVNRRASYRFYALLADRHTVCDLELSPEAVVSPEQTLPPDG